MYFEKEEQIKRHRHDLATLEKYDNRISVSQLYMDVFILHKIMCVDGSEF